MAAQTIEEKLRLIQTLAGECLMEITGGVAPKENTPPVPPVSAIATLDFDINPRAFFKQHAKNGSGRKRAVVLIAFIARGSLEVEVTREQYDALRTNNEGVLGKIYNKDVTLAKEDGWIDSPRDGVYVLTKKWQEALK